MIKWYNWRSWYRALQNKTNRKLLINKNKEMCVRAKWIRIRVQCAHTFKRFLFFSLSLFIVSLLQWGRARFKFPFEHILFVVALTVCVCSRLQLHKTELNDEKKSDDKLMWKLQKLCYIFFYVRFSSGFFSI